MNLILDVKILIASFFAESWISMYIIDEEFSFFAKSNNGIREFKRLFESKVKVDFGIYVEKRYYLLGYIHRDIRPAVVRKSRDNTITYRAWYYKGEPHRLWYPAIICGGYQQWWEHGRRIS